MSIKMIVTHPGQAHRDDFAAVCVLLAQFSQIPVHRREPTEQDLADPEVAVVDVGGRLEPHLMNFDHHQLPREAAPTCALSLVLDHLGLYDVAATASPWVRFSEVLDSKGPTAAMEYAGIGDLDGFASTMSPIESQVLRMFQANAAPDEPLIRFMQLIGQGWLQYWHRFDDRLNELSARSEVHLLPGASRACLVVEIADEPTLGLEAYCKRFEPKGAIAITITRDDRGPGWSLFRRNDTPGVDFSKLKGHRLVRFAHANGFVAKTEDIPKATAIMLAAMACEGSEVGIDHQLV